jgi:hypothetical protein
MGEIIKLNKFRKTRRPKLALKPKKAREDQKPQMVGLQGRNSFVTARH